MSDATIVAISKAIYSYVSDAARAYGTDATYVRTWNPKYKPEQLDTKPVVIVRPSPQHTIGLLNRVNDLEEYQVDIAVQKHVTTFANATVDPISLFAEKVFKSLLNHDLSITAYDADIAPVLCRDDSVSRVCRRGRGFLSCRGRTDTEADD